MLKTSSARLLVAGAASSIVLAAALPALAVSVTVNGQAVTLSPPPLERAGRVFVPLRGVFQQLGASVVYAGGVINANGNGRAIGLKIGSNQATVNGASQPIDTPPFIVGATTYVPLRFVSEALGAGVNYDAANQIVALTPSGQAAAPAPAAAAAAPLANVLRGSLPDRNAFAASTQPTISSTFTRKVDPNTVRIALDGLDVSRSATISETGYVYAPPSPLQSMKHTIVVSGKLQHGEEFSEQYGFTSGTAAPKDTVYLSSPAAASSVGGNFTVSGKSAPNARIHIVAGATASLGGVYAIGAGNYAGDTMADAAGAFSQNVTLQTVSGATIGLTVTATDPRTQESAQKRLTLHAQ